MENYRPRIILSAAITLDGKLATRTGDSKLSSKKDKIRVHKLRSKVDAILIGKKTVEIDDPVLGWIPFATTTGSGGGIAYINTNIY